MAAPIEFYFDFSSPYGYVGANTIDAIAKKYGREVNWHPILLGAVFQITGGTAPVNIPLKSDYFRHDFERTTRLFKVNYQFPSIFPITGLVPARAFYWIHNQNPALAKQFALAAYRAYFVDDRDILGELQGRIERDQQHARADAHALGHGRRPRHGD